MDYWKRFTEWCQRPDMIKINMLDPGRGRIDLSRGVKAGAVSGVVYGALLGSILNIGYNVIFGIINGHLDLFLASFITAPMGILGPIIIAYIILCGVVGGSIVGLTFAALYDRIPGRTPVSKGIVTALIYWFITLLVLPLANLTYQHGFEAGLWFVASPSWIQTVVGLGPSILWGWLLGRFWAHEQRGSVN